MHCCKLVKRNLRKLSKKDLESWQTNQESGSLEEPPSLRMATEKPQKSSYMCIRGVGDTWAPSLKKACPPYLKIGTPSAIVIVK
jgi:hypothetical protein